MGFKTPITIKEVLSSIFRRKYVLPAIQRELVWSADQIRMLFDSIMRGYPIGSFLFWKIDAERAREYRFYDFVTHYTQEKPHNAPAGDVPNSDLVAVLDGQQRLTALNIGFNGSHASKLPKYRWSSEHAFPKKHLYLNLHSRPDEDEMQYDFQVLTPNRALERNPREFWFRVKKILDFDHSADLVDFVRPNDLSTGQEKILHRLHSVAHSDGLIQYYEEQEQDLHKVLNIFVRTNKGGTVLSYSDMLLSVATAEWDKYDAREEIHQFVDDLNGVGHRFSFNKDFVLKACLMLAGLDTKFRVTNFNTTNMRRIQDEWERIKSSLRRTVRFAATVGYDGSSLTATNSLLPLAYYMHRNEHDDRWLTHASAGDDRQRVRRWLIRALLKKGVWGSGLDTLLSGLRKVLQDGSTEFPVEAIERYMEKRGKSLAFLREELEDLADVGYRDPRVYSVLFLLYPIVDPTKYRFHIDHVFPQAKLTHAALAKAGVTTDEIPRFVEKVNGLGNLQLLPGPENASKRATLPTEWLRQAFTDKDSRQYYVSHHDLTGLPEDVAGFPVFYDRRRQKMFDRLQSLLSSRTSSVSG